MATILIVDDRAPDRAYLKGALSAAGYRVIEAVDGEAALELARRERPDLVLADALMPRVDGFALAQRLRAEPDLAHIRVVLVTAHYLEPEARELAAECGVADVLAKPADPEAVLAAVQAALVRETPPGALPAGAGERHLRLLTDKLAAKVSELARANERLGVLVQAGLELAAERNPRKLLQRAAQAARDLIGARFAVIGVLDADGLRVRQLVTAGLDPAEAAALHTPDVRREPIARVLAGRAIRLSGAEAREVAPSDNPDITCWLGAPLVSATGVVGWLGLAGGAGGSFSYEDERLATLLAGQLGRCYQNGAAYERVERHASALERDLALRRAQPAAAPVPAGALFDEFPDALIAVTTAGAIVAWSGGAERLFGHPAADVLGRDLADVIGANERQTELDAWRDALATGRTIVYESERRRRDGTKVVLDVTVRPIVEADGCVRHLAICKKDVTRLHYRREAEVLEARYRGLLEAAPDAMVIVNRDGRILLTNGQALKLFGYSREELLGEPVETLVPARKRAPHPGYRDAYYTDPRPRPMGANVDLAGLRKDGTEFPAEISLSPLRGEGGTPYVAAAVRDVSERRRLEQRKAEEREEQNRRIQEASRLKSEFLANMSHELRTPLNAIIGFSKLLHKGTLGALAPTHREHVGDILASANHLLQLINDVLDLSKVEAGKMEFHREEVALGPLVSGVCETMRQLAVGKRVVLEAEIEPEVERVYADPGRLKQVLYNYLSNALKFTAEGGRVRARARAAGADGFRLEVEDDGIGIAAADLPRLFVEFQQLDASAAKRHQGTGLGLALTRRLVEAMGGQVGVQSEPGRGSTFWAELPRRPG